MVKIIDFEKFNGKYNMDQDTYLFQQFEDGLIGDTLRIYGWERPCISLGYTQDPEKELNTAKCEKFGIEIIKRPTGGGIVFHNEYEVTYSIVCDKDDPRLPKGMVESYKALSTLVVQALRMQGIPAEMSATREHSQARLCFTFPASYEITLEGHKIVGSAQKRGKKALLQQGSIFIRNGVLKQSDFIRNAVEFPAIYDLTNKNVDQIGLSRSLATSFLILFAPNG
jgi:lipoyl(octanoyl) transferase